MNRLSCPVFDESETTPTTSESFEESSVICGSDGETYRSLCHLLQTTNNVRVAHAGSCTSAECQGGEVRGYMDAGRGGREWPMQDPATVQSVREERYRGREGR